MPRHFKIVHIASEVAPFSKTGGLADVVSALTTHLVKLGHQVIIITPLYGFIREKINKGEIKAELVDSEIPLSVAGEKYLCRFFKSELIKDLPVYFVDQYKLFGCHSKLYGYPNDNLRFMLFDLASIELLKLLNFEPNIIHCHDWQTGLIPNYLKLNEKENPLFDQTAIVYTIHNISFQLGHSWWKIPLEERDDGKNLPPQDKDKIERINFMKRGIRFADVINTVSERHAKEILTPEFGQELDGLLRKRKERVFGIINGIDYSVFNPLFDKYIYYNYDQNSLDKKIKNKLALQKELNLEVDKNIPILGLTSRLTEQKGFELIKEIIKPLLRQNLELVIVGSGQKEYVDFFKKISRKYPSKIAFINPFSEEMERKVFAGSDMYLMPSRFEPCGISQLKSLRYGSIPIVHETGGLSDTISDFNPRTGRGNGFVFKTYEPADLLVAITRAVETYKYPQVWGKLTWQAMKESFSWNLPTKKYLLLYRRALKMKNNQH